MALLWKQRFRKSPALEHRFLRNLTCKLENELCCIGHCWGVYEQNSIVKSVRVDDWKEESLLV